MEILKNRILCWIFFTGMWSWMYLLSKNCFIFSFVYIDKLFILNKKSKTLQKGMEKYIQHKLWHSNNFFYMAKLAKFVTNSLKLQDRDYLYSHYIVNQFTLAFFFMILLNCLSMIYNSNEYCCIWRGAVFRGHTLTSDPWRCKDDKLLDNVDIDKRGVFLIYYSFLIRWSPEQDQQCFGREYQTVRDCAISC